MKSFVSHTFDKVIDTSTSAASHANNLIPSLHVTDVVTNLVPDPPMAKDEVILKIPGAILHLVDTSVSVQLACGDLEILRTVLGPVTVSVFARVANDIQWPLIKDKPAVKLDDSHYFLSDSPHNEKETLNYGLTIASKGQDPLLVKLDQILTDYSRFSVKEKAEKNVLDLTAAKETSPEELKGEKKALVEEQCTTYWTTLAPNIKDYSKVEPKSFFGHEIQSPLTKVKPPKMIGAVFESVTDVIESPLTKVEPPKVIGAVFESVTDVIESPLTKVQPPKLIGTVFTGVADVIESPLTKVQPPKLIGTVFAGVADVIESPLTNIEPRKMIGTVFAGVADVIESPLSKIEPPKMIGEVFHGVADVMESPLSKIESAVEESKSFVSDHLIDQEDILNYGKSIASKLQEPLLGKPVVEKPCMAHWTTLAPNAEDYNGGPARLIAAGSGKLIKGIFWCGDVTIDRLMWGNNFLKQRLTKAEKETQVSSATINSLKRMKKVTEMIEKVVTSVVSVIVKVFLFLLSSVVNSEVGKNIFGHPLGEMVLATLDGFYKVFDAVEIAARNVMKTSSTVTTEIVDHKYGAKTAEATNEGLGVAGDALGTVWTVFKLLQALNLKGAMKSSSAKTAMDELEIKGFYERLGAIWHALGMAWIIFKIFQALNPKTPVNPLSLAKILTENLGTPDLLPLNTPISAPEWLKA